MKKLENVKKDHEARNKGLLDIQVDIQLIAKIDIRVDRLISSIQLDIQIENVKKDHEARIKGLLDIQVHNIYLICR